MFYLEFYTCVKEEDKEGTVSKSRTPHLCKYIFHFPLRLFDEMVVLTKAPI